jgi:hypothetical protein
MLCDLISAQAAVLERNVSPQVAAQYKRASIDGIAALGSLLLGRAAELGEPDAVRLAGAAVMTAAALWPHTQPSAAMAAAYEADPALAALRLDFTATLTEVLQVMTAGLLARSAGSRFTMSDEAQVIGLLYRADWTRLCLRAEVNDGSTLLVAPGRRYRHETGDFIKGCDGDRPWELGRRPEGGPDPGTWHMIGGPEPPLRMLLHPGWLLKNWRLDVRGRVTACGRDGIALVATKRDDSVTRPVTRIGAGS